MATVKAPVTSADRLAAAYRAMTAHWLEVIAADVLAHWSPSHVRPGFLRIALAALPNRLALPPAQVIAEVGAEVDRKATANFQRLIGLAPMRLRADAARVLQAGTLARDKKAKAKSRLERVGLTPEMGAAVARFRRNNVERITSLRAEQIARVSELLDEADANGWRPEDLAARLAKDVQTTTSRAELIARDQTLKLHADIQQERQTQSGIRQYRWSTSADERVRGTPGGKWPNGMHYDLDGQIFDWSDPPVTNSAGDRNHPGQDYQCRCIAIPILPSVEEMALSGAAIDPLDDF